MWLRLLSVVTGVVVLLFAGLVITIRTALQHASDDAMHRFSGDRAEALMKVVDSSTCTLKERNHAVWALGQMVEVRSLDVLRKHYDGKPCAHDTRICQYELQKAIRMIEKAEGRSGLGWRLLARLHRPWH